MQKECGSMSWFSKSHVVFFVTYFSRVAKIVEKFMRLQGKENLLQNLVIIHSGNSLGLSNTFFLNKVSLSKSWLLNQDNKLLH